MEYFETAVLAYLTAPGNRFVSPQFALPFKDGEGGSCPDFVVLDFGVSTVYVVEVTTSSNPRNLLSRVREKDKRWLTPLRHHMSSIAESFNGWKYRLTLFVRDEVCRQIEEAVRNEPDVFVVSLDKVVFDWRWDWQEGRAVNRLE